jgi:hypothetical protein
MGESSYLWKKFKVEEYMCNTIKNRKRVYMRSRRSHILKYGYLVPVPVQIN